MQIARPKLPGDLAAL